MDRPPWAPPDVDITTPNPARMYDYSLGGCHNFAADRRLADEIARAMPDGIRIAHANRAFLRRAVRRLAAGGVRQFLDIGSGIPTVGNVHEIALRENPHARVVYVDIDPIAVAHGQVLLADEPSVDILQADLRAPQEILRHPRVTGILDFSEPVAVLLCAVLHFVSDADEPEGIVEALMGATVAGSYLVISHGSRDSRPADAEAVTAAYRRTTSQLSLRTRDEITALFDRMALQPPGVVPATRWNPDEGQDTQDIPLLAGVARRP